MTESETFDVFHFDGVCLRLCEVVYCEYSRENWKELVGQVGVEIEFPNNTL